MSGWGGRAEGEKLPPLSPEMKIKQTECTLVLLLGRLGSMMIVRLLHHLLLQLLMVGMGGMGHRKTTGIQSGSSGTEQMLSRWSHNYALLLLLTRLMLLAKLRLLVLRRS